MAFASAGGSFFQIGTNPESKPPIVPPLFWWKLPDGQRMLCHYHSSYGTPLLPPERLVPYGVVYRVLPEASEHLTPAQVDAHARVMARYSRSIFGASVRRRSKSASSASRSDLRS